MSYVLVWWGRLNNPSAVVDDSLIFSASKLSSLEVLTLEAVIQKSPVRRNDLEVASQAQSSFGSRQSGTIGHQFCARKSPVGALEVAWASQIFGAVVALFWVHRKPPFRAQSSLFISMLEFCIGRDHW